MSKGSDATGCTYPLIQLHQLKMVQEYKRLPGDGIVENLSKKLSFCLTPILESLAKNKVKIISQDDLVIIPVTGDIHLMRHYKPGSKQTDHQFPNPILDEKIKYCTPAAFTNANGHIEGIHVSEGKMYCDVKKTFGGGFVYYKDGTFKFYADGKVYNQEVTADSNRDQKILTAFTNFILIKDGKEHLLKVSSTCHFRSIGEIDGKLYMFVADKGMKLNQFCSSLLTLGVQNAIYQDAAANWEYGWLRTTLKEINQSSSKIKDGIYYWKGTGLQTKFTWSNAIYF